MNNTTHFKSAIFFTSLALSTIGLQAHAFGTADDVDQTVYTNAFKALDTDNSNTLSKSEVRKEKLFHRHFAAADKNHDGSLDQQEYTDYRTQVEQKNVKRIASDSVITSKSRPNFWAMKALKA